MSFVGKILVVIQLVLSVMFMAFAGAVYTTHLKWRDEVLKQKSAVAAGDKKRADLETEMSKVKAEFTAKLTAADQLAAQLDAARKGLEADVARLKKEAGDLQVARKTASGQSLIAAQDAAARKTEADNQRAINHELTATRDAEFAARVKQEDARRSLELALEAATAKNRDLLGRIAIYRQALEAAGISAEITQLASKNSPPPGVDGRITDIKPARKQGASEVVEVSLGSDDGLKLGHEMTVYRSGLNGSQRARYLARIRIVSVTPDLAVAQVIESSRNGVIQKGDNVTTKF
jgi:hypothetical protein